METFYDGYVVNAIIDACYRSAAARRWEPVQLEDWRGRGVARIARERREHDGKTVIKQETMPDGRLKLILKDETTGEFADVVTEGAGTGSHLIADPLDPRTGSPVPRPTGRQVSPEVATCLQRRRAKECDDASTAFWVARRARRHLRRSAPPARARAPRRACEQTPRPRPRPRRGTRVRRRRSPPVTSSGTSASGARSAAPVGRADRAAREELHEGAPPCHAASTSDGVTAPGIAATLRSTQRATIAGTKAGPTHACAPAATARSTSAAVRTVPAGTVVSSRARRRLDRPGVVRVERDLDDANAAGGLADDAVGLRHAAQDRDRALRADPLDRRHGRRVHHHAARRAGV